MGAYRWGTAVAVAATIAIAGCGSSDKAATTKAVAAPTDKRPRVQGVWRVVYRPSNYEGETIRATWTILPTCDLGPCSFRIKSTQKLKTRFVFDQAVGDYRMRDRTHDTCGPADGTIVERKAYVYKRQITLRVTDSIVRDGRRYATRLGGRDFTDATTTKAGIAKDCQDAPDTSDRVVAIRISER